MPNLAANLTLLFTELPFLDRFAAAASAGFRGVEYQFPYDHDPLTLAERLVSNNLIQVLHNLPAGDWTAGERGIACHPDRIQEFRAGVERAVHYASTLHCPRVNCLAGITPPQTSAGTARDIFIQNLQFAAGRLRDAGIALLIEAINTRDVPGFFLCRAEQALDIIRAVGSDNLFFQYDAYHMHIMEGDGGRWIRRHLSTVAHIQVADAPGRHEPGTGEIDFAGLFRWLDEAGYTGWVGCEYNPVGETRAGLAWSRPYLQAPLGGTSRDD